MGMATNVITVLGQDKVFLLREDKHLADILAPHGCHGGGCGICKIKIISGEAKTLCMSKKHVSAEEREEGYALACRVFATGNLVIETLDNNKKS